MRAARLSISVLQPDYRGIGGVQEEIAQLIRHLPQHEWRVYYLRADAETLDHYYGDLPSVGLCRVTTAGLTTRIPDRLHRIEYADALDAFRFSTARIPGDVHLAFQPFSIAAARPRPPLVWYANCYTRYLHEPEVAAELGTPGPLRRACRSWLRKTERRAARRAALVLTNSLHTQGKLKRVLGVDARVVYAGADLLGARSEPLGEHFVYPTRLHRIKRVDLAIEAMRLIPDVRLRIIGEGYDRARLEGLAAGLDNVEIVGFVPNVYEEIAGSRGVLYVPRDEDFGLVPVEAMACGRPVVAADEGGPRETVVDGETGYLVPATAQAIAEKLALLASDADLARRLGEAGRKRSEYFSWRRYADEMNDALLSVVRDCG